MSWAVFHRVTVEDQVKVTRKALAYAELIITSNCRYKVVDAPKGSRVNYVKAYLDKLTIAEVNALRNDTKRALMMEGRHGRHQQVHGSVS
jgi:hypothetical protein